MTVSLRPAGIVGLGSYVPEERVTNFDLAKIVETSDEWIVSRTGIRERRKAAANEAASDLGTRAAEKALADAGITAEEIDLIIVATITPDSVMPSTACIIQNNLGAKKAAAFDLSAACTGSIYALAVANQFVASRMYEKVLVVAPETLSKILNWQDRNTCIIFGDGAGAAVVAPVAENSGFLAFELGADGTGADLLNVPAGGSRKPASHETVEKNEHTIFMAGNEVFKFAVKTMGDASFRVLEKAGLSQEEVDLLVPHQANTRIIDAAVKRLGLSADKVYVNLQKYGNMSGASVPVALDEAVREGRVKKGDLLVLVGFGGGLTWGAAALRWA